MALTEATVDAIFSDATNFLQVLTQEIREFWCTRSSFLLVFQDTIPDVRQIWLKVVSPRKERMLRHLGPVDSMTDSAGGRRGPRLVAAVPVLGVARHSLEG
jgi:hypothetical protein